MMASWRSLVSIVGGAAIGLGVFTAMVLSISKFGLLGWLAFPVVLVVAFVLVLLVLFAPCAVDECLGKRAARKRGVQK